MLCESRVLHGVTVDSCQRNHASSWSSITTHGKRRWTKWTKLLLNYSRPSVVTLSA